MLIYIYIYNNIYIYVCVIHTQIWISKAKMQHPLPQNPVPLAAPRSWPKRKLRRWTCQTSPVVELTFFKTSKMGWIEPNRLNPWAIDWMRANHRELIGLIWFKNVFECLRYQTYHRNDNLAVDQPNHQTWLCFASHLHIGHSCLEVVVSLGRIAKMMDASGQGGRMWKGPFSDPQRPLKVTGICTMGRHHLPTLTTEIANIWRTTCKKKELGWRQKSIGTPMYFGAKTRLQAVKCHELIHRIGWLLASFTSLLPSGYLTYPWKITIINR